MLKLAVKTIQASQTHWDAAAVKEAAALAKAAEAASKAFLKLCVQYDKNRGNEAIRAQYFAAMPKVEPIPATAKTGRFSPFLAVAHLALSGAYQERNAPGDGKEAAASAEEARRLVAALLDAAPPDSREPPERGLQLALVAAHIRKARSAPMRAWVPSV